MKLKTYAGVIGCNMSEVLFQLFSINVAEQYNWKKIFCKEPSASTKEFHGKAEMVADIDSIINDDDIKVVFLSNQYLNIAPQLIQAGKSVRTV